MTIKNFEAVSTQLGAMFSFRDGIFSARNGAAVGNAAGRPGRPSRAAYRLRFSTLLWVLCGGLCAFRAMAGEAGGGTAGTDCAGVAGSGADFCSGTVGDGVCSGFSPCASRRAAR